MQQQLIASKQIKNNKHPYQLKSIVLILGIALYLVYYFLVQIYISEQCIQDLFIEWMLPLNSVMAGSKTWENIIIGLGQIFIDTWVIFMSLFWILKIKNFRFPIAIALTYGVRSILLNIQKFPFTQHWVWDSPGFPSLAVPYDKTRDFFFSGHSSMLIIIFFQLKKLKWYKTSLICLICLIYTIILLLACEVHYIIDIIGAIIFSNYIYELSIKFLVYIEKGFSLPYIFGKNIYLSYLSKKKEKQQEERKNNYLNNQQNILESEKIENMQKNNQF